MQTPQPLQRVEAEKRGVDRVLDRRESLLVEQFPHDPTLAGLRIANAIWNAVHGAPAGKR